MITSISRIAMNVNCYLCLAVYISRKMWDVDFTAVYLNCVCPLCIVGLCPNNPLPVHCLRLVVQMVVVLTCTTMFPLLIQLFNLQTKLCWMKSDLTILVSPLSPGPTYTDAFKFLGSHGSHHQLLVEPKYSTQHGPNEPTRVLLVGDSSN